MKKNTLLESLAPKGHIEIFKIYPNGQRELLFSDHNEITNGMGIALSTLFTAPETEDFTRFQIGYFQIGTGTATLPFSSTMTLGTPLTVGNYGDTTTLTIETHDIYNAGANPPQAFATLPSVQIVKTSAEKVKFILTLDTNTANDLDITELGLFAKDPLSISAAVLVAYRSIPAITKTAGFAISINWTIDF